MSVNEIVECVFNCPPVVCQLTVRIRANAISQFKDGFWINNKFEFTTDLGGKYWIPPSQILYIKKLEDENSE